MSFTLLRTDLGQRTVDFEVLRSTTDFPDLKNEWERLRDSNSDASPYCTWDYLQSWWLHFGHVCPESQRLGTLRIVTVRQDGRLIAIFPMFVEYESPWRASVRRLRFVGFNGNVGAADMTEEPIYLIEPGAETFALQALFRAVKVLARKGEYDILDLRFWWRSPKTVQIPFPYRMKSGPAVVQLPDTWNEYLRQLSRSMRDNLKYYPRLLSRHGHTFEVNFVRDPAKIPAAVNDLARLHKLRIDAAERSAGRVNHMPQQIQRQFLTDALRAMSPNSQGCVAKLVVDGKVVAAQYFLESQNTLLAGYSGFDPEWAPYSPLLVLQSEVFQDAVRRGIHRLDLQIGQRMWQTRWKAEPEGKLLSCTIVRKTPLSLFKAFLHFGGREIRHGLSSYSIRRLFSWVGKPLMLVPNLNSPRIQCFLVTRPLHVGPQLLQHSLTHLLRLR